MSNMKSKELLESIKGCLIGTAVGDSLGLPYEGISPQRQKKLFGQFKGQRLLLGKGFLSDDTEHICMTAQSLIAAGSNADLFIQALAWKLRFWLLGLPAGTGLATLKAILKLWLGFSPYKSGIFSAGNGPAMRSTIIGVCYRNNIPKIQEFVKLSTRITHTDPKAEWGAFSVALASALASKFQYVDPDEYCSELEKHLPAEASEFYDLMHSACSSVKRGDSLIDFVDRLGLQKGITGYIYHTAPTVIHCWLRHQTDFENAIKEIISCGGDTDSTGAILGGIIGARVTPPGIPQVWVDNIIDWPRSISWISNVGERLFDSLSTDEALPQVHLFLPGVLIRNFLFLLLILFHGFRRLFPPY